SNSFQIVFMCSCSGGDRRAIVPVHDGGIHRCRRGSRRRLVRRRHDLERPQGKRAHALDAGGLSALGGRTTVRWLGSTAVEMVLSDAKAPFAAVTLVIFLEPRDLPWWPISRARGRRDTLIIRGVLHQAPAVELEALAPRRVRPGRAPARATEVVGEKARSRRPPGGASRERTGARTR
ncbi:MAG TPA: hypothetical protein VLV15_04100, partial [Dongiaceae bacterium]|nr:hypothetical protein [Dongiaceae bacterium]